MKTKIRLIEDRVREVLGRLQALTQERDGLREELADLERRLAAAVGEGSEGIAPDVVARLDRIGGSLKEAIAELRAE